MCGDQGYETLTNERDTANMKTITKVFIVSNPSGLCGRASAYVCRALQKFKSDIIVENLSNGVKACDKSILSILALKAPKGSQIKTTIVGSDCEEAMRSLDELFSGDAFLEI